MNKNEIKKALYKEKPIATLTALYRDGGSKDYETTLLSGEVVKFHVPIVEQRESTATFEKQMESQLLIRWLIEQ